LELREIHTDVWWGNLMGSSWLETIECDGKVTLGWILGSKL